MVWYRLRWTVQDLEEKCILCNQITHCASGMTCATGCEFNVEFVRWWHPAHHPNDKCSNSKWVLIRSSVYINFHYLNILVSDDVKNSYFAFEAILVPFSIQSDNRILGYWIFATLTFGGEQFLEIGFAVWFAFAFKEWCAGHRFLAWAAAHKMVFVPCFSHSLHNFLQWEKRMNGFTNVKSGENRIHSNELFSSWINHRINSLKLRSECSINGRQLRMVI